MVWILASAFPIWFLLFWIYIIIGSERESTSSLETLGFAVYLIAGAVCVQLSIIALVGKIA
jgi:hypothetical protein